MEMPDQRMLRLFGRENSTPRAIASLADWREHAPPSSGHQWVPLRSAYQLADAWCGIGQPAVPADFLPLFESHPLLGALELHEGWAEHKTNLRGEGRGPRVHDLLLVGRCN